MPNGYPSAPTTCAARTAEPQPPRTSQNVPSSSAASRFVMFVFPFEGPAAGPGKCWNNYAAKMFARREGCRTGAQPRAGPCRGHDPHPRERGPVSVAAELGPAEAQRLGLEIGRAHV